MIYLCSVDRQVTLFEDFMPLKESEKRENSFANKVNTKLSEKEEMQEKVRKYQLLYIGFFAFSCIWSCSLLVRDLINNLSEG